MSISFYYCHEFRLYVNCTNDDYYLFFTSEFKSLTEQH